MPKCHAPDRPHVGFDLVTITADAPKDKDRSFP